jgi:hypothetical protein
VPARYEKRELRDTERTRAPMAASRESVLRGSARLYAEFGCSIQGQPEPYSAQISTRPSRRSLASTMMPGPCFSMSSIRNETPRSSQPW